jgi:hypothetical protein
MNPSDPNPDAAALPPPITSRAEFAAALRWALDRALADGARTLLAADPDFDELWPWDDEPLRQALAGWLRLPQRRLVLLAAHYDAFPRRHPRFTAWRRDWAHAIDARIVPEELADRVPTLWHDDQRTSVHLREREPCSGRASIERRTRLLWQERSDALLQRSSPGFAVTTLGL